MQDCDEMDETCNVICNPSPYILNDDGLVTQDYYDFEDQSGLPRALIVAHVPDDVFDSVEAKVSSIL